MKIKVYLLALLIFSVAGCTKNNQNDPSSFAYLSVNQSFYVGPGGSSFQNYDINNDGQIDWAIYAVSEGLALGYPNFTTGHFSSYVGKSSTVIAGNIDGAKILPYNYLISSNDLYDGSFSDLFTMTYKPNILGTGDFFIGFKSQNATRTNTFYGWARLNVDANMNTLTVIDMALNKVNGGSIRAGQH